MNQPIELRHLRHFIALAEELHFGRAAKRCHISQPPFSVSIQQLEQQLGFALVERSPQGVRLTVAGAAFYDEAVKALAQVAQALEVATRVNGGMQGMLKVGFMASMLPRGLKEVVNAFESEYPQVELQLVELSSAEQIIALQRRQIHYGFLHVGVLPGVVRSQELLHEPFVLCLPENHPRARITRAELTDFRNESFILFARAYSPTYYDQVVSICLEAGFHPKVKHEVRHWLTVMACVSMGMGVSLVPAGLARTGLQGLRFIHIGDTPIQSVVRGAWLESDKDDVILSTWRDVVSRVWGKPGMNRPAFRRHRRASQ